MKTLPILFLSCVLLIITFSDANAQYSEREIGINTSNLQSLGLDYKKKTGENKYLRLRASFGDFSYTTSVDDVDFSNFILNAGIALGFERRKSLGEKTFCLHGFAPSASFGLHADFQENTRLNLSVGLAYMLGIAYEISDNFYTAVEITPGIQINYRNGSENILSSISLGGNFNQDFLNLSINYRFNKSE